MKQEIIDFRKEIAALEVEQKNAKEQRRTVRFTGERTMSPYEAWSTARNNKERLRCMYAAYGLMRGKTFAQTESHAKPVDKEQFYIEHGYSPEPQYVGKHPLYMYCDEISTLLEDYGYHMPYETVTYKNCWGEEKTKKVFNPDTCEKIVRFGEQEA